MALIKRPIERPAPRRLLRETKKSVATVALQVGNASPSHFAQVFRRETGISPSDYRRQRYLLALNFGRIERA